MGKPTMWFPNRSDTHRPVQLQKRARILKFRISAEEELYYLSSENKGAVTAKLICAFVFAYADCWFSHEEAHMLLKIAAVLDYKAVIVYNFYHSNHCFAHILHDGNQFPGSVTLIKMI